MNRKLIYLLRLRKSFRIYYDELKSQFKSKNDLEQWARFITHKETKYTNKVHKIQNGVKPEGVNGEAYDQMLLTLKQKQSCFRMATNPVALKA